MACNSPPPAGTPTLKARTYGEPMENQWRTNGRKHGETAVGNMDAGHSGGRLEQCVIIESPSSAVQPVLVGVSLHVCTRNARSATTARRFKLKDTGFGSVNKQATLTSTGRRWHA